MTLRKTIDSFWGNDKDKPLLIGPELSWWNTDWITKFANLTNGAVDRFTYHIYSLGAGSSKLNPHLDEEILSYEHLDKLKDITK